MSLPAGVTTGLVTGTFNTLVAGASVPVDGMLVVFTPSSPVVLDAGATQTLGITAVTGVVRQGILYDASGAVGVTLIATDSAGITPTGFTWLVQFQGPVPLGLNSFSFALPGGTTKDLATISPIPPVPGVPSMVATDAVVAGYATGPGLTRTFLDGQYAPRFGSATYETFVHAAATYAPMPPGTDEIIYVAPSGSDSTGNGRTPGSAFRTLTAAVAALPTSLTAGVCIRMAPGAYAETGNVAGGGLDVGQRKNLVIEGAGMGATVLMFTGTGSSIISDFAVNSATGPTHVLLRSFSFSNSNALNVGAGFEQRVGSVIQCIAVGISGHKYGIIFDQTEEGHIDLCDLQNQITGGIWLTHGPDWTPTASMTPPFTNNITITRNNINESSTCVGIIDDGGWAHGIESNSINGCSNQIIIAGMSGGVIRGNEMESCAGHNILVNAATYKSATAAGSCIGLLISHNTIDTAATGNAAIYLAQNNGGNITLLSNSFSSTGAAVRGVATVDTLVSIGNFNGGTGGVVLDAKAANHVQLDRTELALIGPAFKSAIKYNPPPSGTNVFLDMGNGSVDGNGGAPAFGVGRGDPSLIGSLDLRGGNSDTFRIRMFINGLAALQVIGNGAGSSVTLSEARDLIFGTATGTKIGTAVGQKIGFWGATPRTQPNGYSVSTPQSLKTMVGDGTDTLATVGEILGRVITDLKSAGILGS